MDRKSGEWTNVPVKVRTKEKLRFFRTGRDNWDDVIERILNFAQRGGLKPISVQLEADDGNDISGD